MIEVVQQVTLGVAAVLRKLGQVDLDTSSRVRVADRVVVGVRIVVPVKYVGATKSLDDVAAAISVDVLAIIGADEIVLSSAADEYAMTGVG